MPKAELTNEQSTALERAKQLFSNWRKTGTMSDIVLINITGKDRKGLDAKFTGILAEFGVNILDIGQAVIHEHISLGILTGWLPKPRNNRQFQPILTRGFMNHGLVPGFVPQHGYSNPISVRFFML